MRHPRVVVCAIDDWTAKQLGPLTAERRWLLRAVRQPGVARDLVCESRPTVLVVQVDPEDDHLDPLRLVADVHWTRPDVSTVVLSDAKLSEDDRTAWTASVFDLGARCVLFPPLTRAVLEDVVDGLMTATIGRVIGAANPHPGSSTEVIDLADGGYETP